MAENKGVYNIQKSNLHWLLLRLIAYDFDFFVRKMLEKYLDIRF